MRLHRIISALAASLALATGLVAAGAAPPSGGDAAKVERYLAGLSTWSADFDQTITDENGKLLRSAAGHLYLQRPGKFRWDYSAPAEQLVLADGKKLWFYDKDLAQANVRDLDSSLAGTPAMLLSGGASLDTQFEITALPPDAGLEWFQLKPRHQDTDFLAVRIGFVKGELARMQLADKLNQVTSLKFSSPQRNLTLAPDLFSFVPPPGVDVIGRAPQ
jgi:outer membrane lipoprotein carrier protein